MHTEEEAKKKWCPTMGLMHAIDKTNPVPLCFASDCMSWRWQKGTEYEHADGSKTDNEKGRCGLAGRNE